MRIKILQILILSIQLSFSSWAQTNWLKNEKSNALEETKFVSIVFASENLNEVTSMFGHTFLVFHNNPKPNLADSIVEFRGVMNQGVEDYFFALSGHLLGRYEINNFIYKLREYHLEGRDLWAYRLNLKSHEIHALVIEINKKLNVDVNYSFFNQNCSYRINELIFRSVKIEFENYFYTIPLQSILELKNKNLLSDKYHFYPSEINLINTYLSVMPRKRVLDFKRFYDVNDFSFKPKDNVEKKTYNLLINKKAEVTSFDPVRNEIFRLKKQENFVADKDLSPLEQKEIRGHSYFSLSSPLREMDDLRFDIRPALRSFITSQDDLYKFSSLDIGHLILRKKKESFHIDELNIIKMESIFLDNFFYNRLDSSLDFSFYNFDFLNKNQKELVLRYGKGDSFFIKKNISFSLMPFLGFGLLSKFHTELFNSEIGIDMSAQLHHSSKFHFKSSFLKIWSVQNKISQLLKLESSYRLSSNWSSFLRLYQILDPNEESQFSEVGLAYLF